MKITAKLRRIGNSQGVYISKDVITSLGLKVGENVALYTKEPDKVITSAPKPIQDKVYTNVITPDKQDNVITYEEDSYEEDEAESIIR